MLKEDLAEKEFHEKQREERRLYTKQMVAEAVRRDMETKDQDVIDGQDSDGNLPAFAHDEEEDREYLNS